MNANFKDISRGLVVLALGVAEANHHLNEDRRIKYTERQIK